jgi:hypothetical protein
VVIGDCKTHAHLASTSRLARLTITFDLVFQDRQAAPVQTVSDAIEARGGKPTGNPFQTKSAVREIGVFQKVRDWQNACHLLPLFKSDNAPTRQIVIYQLQEMMRRGTRWRLDREVMRLRDHTPATSGKRPRASRLVGGNRGEGVQKTQTNTQAKPT